MSVDVLQPAGGAGAATHVIIDGQPVAITGTVTIGGQPISVAVPAGVDVTDRAGRLLGHVTVDGTPAVSVTGAVAVTDTPATDDTATLLRLILRELVVNNLLLQAGLNVRDELDALRADPVLAAIVN